jgi:hypothetical protein
MVNGALIEAKRFPVHWIGMASGEGGLFTSRHRDPLCCPQAWDIYGRPEATLLVCGTRLSFQRFLALRRPAWRTPERTSSLSALGQTQIKKLRIACDRAGAEAVLEAISFWPAARPIFLGGS